MNEVVAVTGLSNREFLDAYAQPGRVGLAGATMLIDAGIGRAQRHVDPDKTWGRWSHAFLFQGIRHDRRHWVIESDLQIHHKHVRLGVQENRVDKFYDQRMYESLAVLDFGLVDEQVACLLARGLDLVAARTRYSLRELVGTLVALRHPSLRGRANLLARPRSFYCSAFVHHLFRSSGLDLVPGVDEKNTTPEDLWRTLAPHTTYLLARPARPGRKTKVIQKLQKLDRKRKRVGAG